MRRLRIAICVCAALALAAGTAPAAVQPAPELARSAVAVAENGEPKKTIVIDFDSTAVVAETGGVAKKATPSGLTAAQKQRIIDTVQAQYDAAAGAGTVEVAERTKDNESGENIVPIVVSGGSPPNDGRHFGEAGRPNRPGIVYVEKIKQAYGEFTEDQIANAVSEVLAHEAGHKLGLSHNWDNPASKMSEGTKVTEEQLRDASLEFNDDDSKKLKDDLGVRDRTKKSRRKKAGRRLHGDIANDPPPRVLLATIGETLDPPPVEVFAIYLNAAISFQGSFGARFGFVGLSEEFIGIGDDGHGPGNPGYFTFIYDGFIDFALFLPDRQELVRLTDPGTAFSVSRPNPYNSRVFSHAEITFPTSAGAASLFLDILLEEPLPQGPVICRAEPHAEACSSRTTGGFEVSRVPVPASWLLLATGGLMLVRPRRAAA